MDNSRHGAKLTAGRLLRRTQSRASRRASRGEQLAFRPSPLRPTCAPCDCSPPKAAARGRRYGWPMGDSKETERVLRGYADAWLAGDVERIVGAYHEDVALHYMGESPLAGTHT